MADLENVNNLAATSMGTNISLPLWIHVEFTSSLQISTAWFLHFFNLKNFLVISNTRAVPSCF